MLFDKIIEGKAHNTKYKNGYIITDDICEMHIFNKDKDVIVLFNKIDLNFFLNYFWCAFDVGRIGSKQIHIYTNINRIHYKLGRLLLNVNNSNLKVEHKDRNSLNFCRNNIYIVNKNSKKNKIPSKTEYFGISKVKQNTGKDTGYIVYYYDENNKKTYKYFGIKKYKTLDKAKEKAIEFRSNVN